MAKKNARFVPVYKDGNYFKYEGKRVILVDTVTGVNYLTWQSGGYGGGITPLLDSEGKVVVTKVADLGEGFMQE